KRTVRLYLVTYEKNALHRRRACRAVCIRRREALSEHAAGLADAVEGLIYADRIAASGVDGVRSVDRCRHYQYLRGIGFDQVKVIGLSSRHAGRRFGRKTRDGRSSARTNPKQINDIAGVELKVAICERDRIGPCRRVTAETV